MTKASDSIFENVWDVSDKPQSQSSKEILEKAIQKAIDGGWKPSGFEENERVEPFVRTMDYEIVGFGHVVNERVYVVGQDNQHYKQFIFNHDFAKALWGEEHSFKREKVNKFDLEGTMVCQSCGEYDRDYPINCYLIHLQQMVIADDPIKYLGENI